MVLHIRVVPPLLSSFVECPLSDSMYWMIGHFRRYVPERLLNAKVVVFLGFLWFTVDFYSLKGVENTLEKCIPVTLKDCAQYNWFGTKAGRFLRLIAPLM